MDDSLESESRTRPTRNAYHAIKLASSRMTCMRYPIYPVYDASNFEPIRVCMHGRASISQNFTKLLRERDTLQIWFDQTP